jgi:hypothetical protein
MYKIYKIKYNIYKIKRHLSINTIKIRYQIILDRIKEYS